MGRSKIQIDASPETVRRLAELEQTKRNNAGLVFRNHWRCDDPNCEKGLPHGRWQKRHARGAQVLVNEPNRIFYAAGGRGSGKTWAGARNLAEKILCTQPEGDHEYTAWGVIGPSFLAAKTVCIESESGLLRALKGFVETWNRSEGLLRLTTGAVIYVDGASDEGTRIQGKHLYGAWCVAEGEPVMTDAGPRPVEAIRSGERIWTRSGWRQASAARCTGRQREILCVTTGDSRAMRVTSDHRVWTEDGWLPAGQLRPGMRVGVSQPTVLPLGSSGAASAGIGVPRSRTTTPTALVDCFTLPSGSTLIDGDSRQVGCSTTSTATVPTTDSTTSNPCPEKITSGSMTAWDARNLGPSVWPSARRRKPHGLSVKPGRLSALSAVRRSTRLGNVRDSAAGSVDSLSTVRSVEPAGRADVYDLSVDGAHEFTIDGIVVHNCDEVGLWQPWERAWRESLMPAVHLGPAWVLCTGTPKPSSLVKELLGDPETGRVRWRTVDNLHNLSDDAVDWYRQRYEGTRLGRQELEGLLVEDIDGALWTRELLDRSRVEEHDPAFWHRKVVALDPAGGFADGDEQGLCVVGHSAETHELYVLESSGHRLKLWDFLKLAVELAQQHDAMILLERDAMDAWGVMLRKVIEDMGAAVYMKTVRPQGSKRVRAEPVAAIFEQGRAHLVGYHPELEDQLCTFTGVGREPSPDRLDAMVHAMTEFVSYDLTMPDASVPVGALAYSDEPVTGGAVSWS